MMWRRGEARGSYFVSFQLLFPANDVTVMRSASGHMLEMMHGLDMNANSVAAAYSPDSNMGAPTMHDGGNGNHHHNGANDYPSPSSTASPGQTRAPSLPLSTSSELVYALQNQDRVRLTGDAMS
jgi:hypothetical protein